ncbi:hypothetical protein HD554DRAFT_2117567 [Boletus coccyginus]|nr:hypothetical protein HD554DRAFT_2117567 [Boletus coccyginus]
MARWLSRTKIKGVAFPSKVLSESRLREICLEYLDECIYNDLPQYLIRISDMRLYSHDELWENFRPLVDTMSIDVEEAERKVGRWRGKEDVRRLDLIKRLLRFAIFSHRWGTREPVFRDMSSKIYGDRPHPDGPGYEKLLRFRERAKEYGGEYVWTDSCCINKESSAELEEAIRLMYRWYQDAFVCIVYLAMSSSVEDFRKEPWFTRGWTLQELLASKNLRMYGKDWTPICPKEEENTLTLPWGFNQDQRYTQQYSPPNHLPNDKRSIHMLDAISKATGIDADYVREFNAMEVLLPEKMRWASKRKTTRAEDISYSLLGIFNVSMPIAYGEGKHSQDPNFFAWAGSCSNYSLALPSSPSSFEARVTALSGGDRGYTVQKLGIQVNLLLIQMHVHHSDHHYMLQPLDVDISQIVTVSRESCALGIVNFDRRPHRSGNEDDNGILFSGKLYFCMLIKPSPVSLGSTFGEPSLQLDTGGILPMIECKKDYGARPTTVCLIHAL